MPANLDNQILEYLATNPGKTAREIGEALGEDKKPINSRLYGVLKGQVVQDSAYRWSLLNDAADEQPAQSSFANTDLARLSRYYLACLGQDANGVSVFAESKFAPNYMELDALSANSPGLWSSEAGRTMLAQLRKDKSRLMLQLGFPCTLHQRRSKRSSWQGYMVEPVFLFPVQMDDQQRPSLDMSFPNINPEVVKRYSNAAGQDIMAELVQLEEELGLANADVAPELDDLVARLRAVRPEWPWEEEPDLDALCRAPSLAEMNKAGIFNRAVLLVSERSPFTQGLEAELTQLARLGPGASDGTALGDWLAGAAPRQVGEPVTPLEVLPMNLEQRQAVSAALNQSLTIITGPPGTGKSQVVTNLLVNAAWMGKRVLFASKNNKAVDVVEQRVNNLGPRPVLLRLGSQQYQTALAEYLIALLSATTSESDEEEYAECQARHEQLKTRLDATSEKMERLVELRNRTDNLDRVIETLREQIGDQALARMRHLDLDELRAQVQGLVTDCKAIDPAQQGFFVRLFWFLVRNGRYARLKQNAEALADLIARLSLQLPRQAPGLPSVSQWQTFQQSLQARSAEAEDAISYFQALEELEGATSLEELSAEYARIEKAMGSNAERLWIGWLRLKPKQMSHSDRQLLNKYAGTLKMVIGHNADEKLPSSVYREYSGLFPKVSHMLSCWAVTSLSAKGRIPFEPGYFDIVVFDEASQCDIASALPLLYRAKAAVVIGDPKQLSHISSLVKGQDQQLLDKFNLISDYPHWAFSFNSLFELAAGMSTADAVISLRDHHRSHADIISFSNAEFYEGRLRVATAYDRLQRPDPVAPGISWVNVVGEAVRPATGGAQNVKEAQQIAIELEDLVIKRGYEGSVGVVTPFRAQANLIRQVLSKNDRIYERLIHQGLLVDTVHKFQGDERDLMVFSPVISKGTPNGALGFLSSNGNLFNVAITRARGQLLVVGDAAACASSGVGYMERFAHYTSALAEKQQAEQQVAEKELGPRYPDVSNPEQVSDWEVVFYEALYRAGIKAIPQYGVEKYRLDFAVFAGDRKLNLEVDGERYHRNWTGELCRRDQLRNQRMFELGWDVMRFWVYEIRDDLDRSVNKVKAWVEGQKL